MWGWPYLFNHPRKVTVTGTVASGQDLSHSIGPYVAVAGSHRVCAGTVSLLPAPMSYVALTPGLIVNVNSSVSTADNDRVAPCAGSGRACALVALVALVGAMALSLHAASAANTAR